MSVYLFQDNNVSKYQWIFTKLGMCIDIMEIWFWLQIGKLRQLLTELTAHHMIMVVLSFHVFIKYYTN